eukprot:SM000014S00363  [mRNA]  locus=s14:892587:893732:- [translate_table: standard]
MVAGPAPSGSDGGGGSAAASPPHFSSAVALVILAVVLFVVALLAIKFHSVCCHVVLSHRGEAPPLPAPLQSRAAPQHLLLAAGAAPPVPSTWHLPPRSRGLSAEAVALLPSYTFSSIASADGGCATEAGGRECAVCLAEYVHGDTLRRLPACNHAFHAACVDPWLGDHLSCPVCRKSVVAGELAAGPEKTGDHLPRRLPAENPADDSSGAAGDGAAPTGGVLPLVEVVVQVPPSTVAGTTTTAPSAQATVGTASPAGFWGTIAGRARIEDRRSQRWDFGGIDVGSLSSPVPSSRSPPGPVQEPAPPLLWRFFSRLRQTPAASGT